MTTVQRVTAQYETNEKTLLLQDDPYDFDKVRDYPILVSMSTLILVSITTIVMLSMAAVLLNPVACHAFTDPFIGCGLAFSCLSLLLAPLIIYKYGKRARKGDESCVYSCKGRTGYLTCCTLVGTVFVGMCVVAGYVIVFAATATLSNLEITTVEGLHGSVSITRASGTGIATIEAKSLSDALLGQGFIHAQDRIVQLMLQRWVAHGKLSSIIGSAGLDLDKMSLTYNVLGVAQHACDNATPFSIAHMQAYVDGINLYINRHITVPFELNLIGKKFMVADAIDPFTVLDVCTTLTQLQLQMSSNCDVQEVKRWGQILQHGRSYDEIELMYPSRIMNERWANSTVLSYRDIMEYGDASTLIDPQEALANDAASRATERSLLNELIPNWMKTKKPLSSSSLNGNEDDDNTMFGAGMMNAQRRTSHRGSNAFVTRGPDRVAPVISSDPHLELTLPSIWFYNRIVVNGNNNVTKKNTVMWEVLGATHPGVPGILIGMSQHISLGITLSESDICDLFVLTPGAHPNEYMVNNTVYNYSIRRVTIEVQGGSNVELVLKDSVYGPIVSDLKGVETSLPIAIWHSALKREYAAKSLNAILLLLDPNIQTVTDLYTQILQNIMAPGLSIVFGDSSGGYGWAMTGAHPNRRSGHTGRYPIPGNGSFDYVNVVPMNELPSKVVSAERQRSSGSNKTQYDFIAAANQQPFPFGYKYVLGYDFEVPYRAARIQSVLGERNGTSALTDTSLLQDLQRDGRSNVWAFDLVPIFANDTELRKDFPLLDDLLTKWSDGMITPDSTEPTHLWDFLTNIPNTNRIDERVVACLNSSRRNDIRAGWQKATEKRNAATRWGDSYGYVNIPNLMLGTTPLSCLGNRELRNKVGGDQSSVNTLTLWNHETAGQQWAPSMRQVMELDKGSLWLGFPGGSQENPFGEFYDNLLSGYEGGSYHLLALNGTGWPQPKYTTTLLP